MLFKFTSYINFLIKSTNRHGVHSPFVFDLVEKCFNKKTDKNLFKRWLKNKTDLLNNPEQIDVTDFGAGSKVFKSNLRKVSAITKVAGISNPRAKLLIRLVQYFNPTSILEVGTSLGLATTALALGNQKSSIITLEGCPETARIANLQFQKNQFNTIKIIVGDFSSTLHNTLNNNTFDFIFFDGNHTKQATINYFVLALNSIHNNSVLVFDDIHWSIGMEEAWNYIQNHPKVTVTIDTYQWGLVFFRKEQAKEHFILRV